MKEKILELLENKKFNELKQILVEENIQDIAILFEELNKEQIILVYRLIPKDMAAEVFTYLEPEYQEKLINMLSDEEIKNVVNNIYIDDMVDLIEEMPSNVVKRVLKNVKQEQRKIINEFLNYPSDSAGSMMTIEFVDLKENMTVEQAFQKIKKIGLNKETIYTCYVLDMSRKLIGLVSVRDLLLAEKDDSIKEIMETNIITVNTLDDKEEVVKKFEKYDFIALPVVDKEERLVGIITIDDAIDVLQEETTEDFEKMAAMIPSEETYFRTGAFTHAKNRIIWLLVLMLSAAITGEIITYYESAFATLPLLVAFIPMIMGTGGNCGSQASTLIIRGLAMDEIRLKDFWRALFKELKVSIIVGLVLFLINGIRIVVQYNDFKLAIVTGLALIATVILAKLLGCILPMVAKKIKLDPAIMAAPLITTIVDTCSVLVYFSIAVVIMGI
ncbi:MAG: magnesium transporter [Clostridiales bacterium]|nr:magnesium transporter [Clostridiales bacterium]